MDKLSLYYEACKLYNLNQQFIDIEKFNKLDKYYEELSKNGFVVIENLIDKEILSSIKDFWKLNIKKYETISSDLCFGQKNYTKNFFNRYQRHFDFYWNRPTSKITRELSLQLHFLRNILTGYNPYYGLILNEQKFGVYLAITKYPSGSGEMAIHVDPNSYLPFHYNLPLTFKGKDYLEGGLHIKNGEEFIDIEEMISLGDLILFNGSIPHKIDMIKGHGSQSNLGRMQMFAVPTYFSQLNKKSFIRNLLFEFYGRFKYRRYSKGKGLKNNHENLR
jgi:hypothetical protein